jgi:hypothetical protein
MSESVIRPTLRGWWAPRKGLKQCARCPQIIPGEWVRLQSGKVARVRSLSFAITAAYQRKTLWHVHLTCGYSVPLEMVERLATPDEQRRAEQYERQSILQETWERS